MYLLLLGPIDLPVNCRATLVTHTVTAFLFVTYAILNASVILERNEKRLERNEKCLERNETRLARNETRGGNLLLSGTVEAAASLVFLFSPLIVHWPANGLSVIWVIPRLAFE